MMKNRAILLLLSVAAAGCSSVTGPRHERQPAYIRLLSMPAQFDAPDTVAVGVAFTVTVRTYGGGCIDQGDTQVSVTGQTVEIRPFDVFTTHLPANYGCPDNLLVYNHTASVHLDQPGTATLRAIGRVSPGDSATTLERTIVVI